MQSTLEQMSTQANDTKLLRGIVVISSQTFPEIQEKEKFPVQFIIGLLDIKVRKICHKNNSNKHKGIILNKLAACRRLADYKKWMLFIGCKKSSTWTNKSI